MPPVSEPARRIRPLPRTLRPVHHETIDSYLVRLAAANALSAETLQRDLDATPSRRNQALLDRLAAASRQPPASLSRALVEFQYLDTGPPAYRPGAAFPRRENAHGVAMVACQLCMAARGITTPVVVFTPSYQRVCLRHGRWLVWRQLDVGNVPEIVHAQRRQRWIARRRGRRDAANAYGDAAHIIRRWLQRGDHPGLHQRWAHRLTRLGETRQFLEFNDPVLLAATYPETVALSGVLVSPHWTSMAASDDAIQHERFYAEAARRLGIPSAQPVNSFDPLARWSRELRRWTRSDETPLGEWP